jgi:hypothetical protein
MYKERLILPKNKKLKPKPNHEKSKPNKTAK